MAKRSSVVRKSAVVKDRAEQIVSLLAQEYPDAACALEYDGPLQLLIATILSAQCTDKRVNMVTPALFRRYADAASFAAADPRELQKAIQSTGFFRNKAKNIQACCRTLVAEHAGQVPRTMAEMVVLPGVGRKTANVVLGNAYGIAGIPVDTHVQRLSRRLGLTRFEDPVKIEKDLMVLVPESEWIMFGHRLIHHGRKVCHARKPNCEGCVLAGLCPKTGVEVKAKPATKTEKKSVPGQAKRSGLRRGTRKQ